MDGLTVEFLYCIPCAICRAAPRPLAPVTVALDVTAS